MNLVGVHKNAFTGSQLDKVTVNVICHVSFKRNNNFSLVMPMIKHAEIRMIRQLFCADKNEVIFKIIRKYL